MGTEGQVAVARPVVWALILAAVASLGCAPRVSTRAGFTDPADAVRLAAFQYATDSLYRAPPPGERPICFSLYPEETLARPPRGERVDPSEELLRHLQERHAAARRGSACTLDYALPTGSPMPPDRPIFYFVGAVRLRGAREAEVSVGYHFHGLNAAGRSCFARFARGSWTVTRCEPGWVS